MESAKQGLVAAEMELKHAEHDLSLALASASALTEEEASLPHSRLPVGVIQADTTLDTALDTVPHVGALLSEPVVRDPQRVGDTAAHGEQEAGLLMIGAKGGWQQVQ